MKTSKIRVLQAGFCLGALYLALAGCATKPPGPAADVRTRVEGRLAALGKGDIEAAYAYLSPGYRSGVTLDQYRRAHERRKVRWQSARYVDSDCSESACKVRVSVDFVLVSPVPGMKRYYGTQTAEENWIKSRGSWWYLPEE